MTVFLSFHTWLMKRGLSTIEFCEKTTLQEGARNGSIRSRYDYGLYWNICSVLGPNPWLWLLPISPPVGDGVLYVDPRTEAAGALCERGDTEASEADPEWTGTAPVSGKH